ncbi:CYB5A family protein [Megaselia abdita]
MSSSVKEISILEVKKHNTPEDLWMVIHDKVYDLTKFRSEHPGGDDVLDEYAGKEASKAFDDVGHSSDAVEMMAQYCVGELAVADRKAGGSSKKTNAKCTVA